MKETYGKRNWVFPDAEMPPAGDFELKGHESIIILNMNDEAAQIGMTLYFEDREPKGPIAITVAPERVRCLRMDNPQDVGGYAVQRMTQYAVSIASNLPVVVQYGRLDTRNQPMAFYINSGYAE